MKDLIIYLADTLKIKNHLLLEKDILLHRILIRLMNTSFKENYAFKGGTCLTKCYLGYYRFSEDLDFTFIHQNEFEGFSQKKLRKILSKKINKVLEQLVLLAKDLKLDFKLDKSDSRYVVLGGNNKFVTFKLWYKPVVGVKEEFIKVQINYYELIINNIVKMQAHSLFSSIPKNEIELLQPEHVDLIDDVELMAYSLNEIFLEKIRAILTRRGTKSRDYIDLYLITEKINVNFEKEEENILRKIKFMLVYDKYLQNLSVINPENLILGEEENLLLEPLDKNFEKFLPSFFEYLKQLEEKLNAK
ncbi:nucleotidyl transferase AbiEii/AbiGii toxin family protein [Candidatus Woesearchaeota archaeon]|nr:nucleotidyl transferase AbiEii/AbiGii toxin family protein [Candidatus Woesearchaeota archaeon]MBT6519912.1 nucleotidyl transferase AbiEii/AbiGii toxin family protein [Candidatus Woesearchaeota archaeon]MBT7367112.1 nucleotidyl transferase AbiEii/AbiGii toxin family protein [Candidatus Woesearchaeota archaeon]